MLNLLAVADDPWRWEPHPEVWFLVGAIIMLGVWSTRIGPRVLPLGTPVATTKQKWSFVTATLLLYAVADWPIHDIAEEHLYLVHMIQHMVITLIAPPLFLLAMPVWLARLIILDGGWGSRLIRKLSHPVAAAVIFNALAAITHWSGMVQWSFDSGMFHYFLHLVLFVSALLMWLPVVSPLQELRLSPPGQMLYLFLNSVIPTIPAAWLTFAEGTVYKHYDNGYELWGISVVSDQQAAGVIMKIIGGFYLWGIILVKFYRYTASIRDDEQRLRPAAGR
ncbi:MAG TPA: cytochrome c oxidase assembly protein [Acidimicrobiia bacterium]|jgi:putative membrane protein|nr:cytochrome c oxidase assembly protein [Acidimicrobiia bacterium]HIL45855.1 cytochrome c oxidase assembly protein [Acidimicrobiia bacterium]